MIDEKTFDAIMKALDSELEKSKKLEETSTNDDLVNWKDRQFGYTNGIIEATRIVIRTIKKEL